MKTQLTYNEFRTARINFNNSQDYYLQNIENDFEGVTKFAYKMYLTGKIPTYAKQ